MSDKSKDQIPQPPIPKRCFILPLASIYFFYRAKNYFYVRDYDAGMFMVLAGVMMLGAAYAFYRGSRY